MILSSLEIRLAVDGFQIKFLPTLSNEHAKKIILSSLEIKLAYVSNQIGFLIEQSLVIEQHENYTKL